MLHAMVIIQGQALVQYNSKGSKTFVYLPSLLDFLFLFLLDFAFVHDVGGDREVKHSAPCPTAPLHLNPIE